MKTTENDKDEALSSLRHILNYQLNQLRTQEKEKEETLNEIFVKTKKNQLTTLFVNKIKRTTNKIRPIYQFEKYPSNQQEGIRYPRHLLNAVLFLSIIFLIIILMLSSFQGFIRAFREEQFNNAAIITLKIIALIIALMRFFMKCSRVTFKSGVEIKYLQDIVLSYIKSGLFFLDIFFIVMILLFLILPFNQIVGIILFFVTLLTLIISTNNDLTVLESEYVLNDKFKLYWDLVKIALFNLLFAHFVASILFGMSEIDLENNWLTFAGINDELWHVQYLYGYYWATTIMMTVGFGDFLPLTQQEAIITAFLQIFSCVILAYNISEIGSIISRIRQQSQDIQRKLALFDKMTKKLENNKENKYLARNISDYIIQSEYLKNHFQYEAMDELLSELPEHLRKDFTQKRNSAILKTLPFFNNLKEGTINSLAQCLERELFYPGAHLEKGDENKLYILEMGTIGYGYKKKGSLRNGEILEHIKSAEHQNPVLLKNDFLKFDDQLDFHLIAYEYSIVWTMKLDDFHDKISESIIDSQYYFSILHKHSFDGEQWENIKCERCSFGKVTAKHTIFQCPTIHYKPFKLMIANKHLFCYNSENAERKIFKREKNKQTRTSSLKLRKKFFKEVERFRLKLRAQAQANEYENQPLDKQSRFEEQSESKNEKLKNTIIDAIKFYDTDYKEDFWDLNLDELHNFAFYFPNSNPNRLVGKELKRKSTRYSYKNLVV